MATVTIEQLTKVKGILEQLDHAIPLDMADNRRQAPRVNVRLSLDVILLTSANPTPIQIFTRNLSTSGLGFVSRRLFKAQERIAVRFNVKDLAAKLCLARVTFGRYITGGLYEMGAEFLECVKDTGHTPVPSHWMLSIAAVRIGKTPGPGTSGDAKPAESTPAESKPEEKNPA